MIGNAWSRRAEEFDALVSGRTSDLGDHADLLDVVAALRSMPAPEARSDFVSTLRTQLVAAAEREPARVDAELAARLTPRQRRGSGERRLAAVVGGFAVVSATGSMAMASQGALPGDVLYPVKRAIENAQVNLQGDDAARAATLIAHAEARLAEVEELTARDADGDVISATLQDFTEQTSRAAELALDDYAATGQTRHVTALRAFAADSMDVLSALGPVVPDSARPALITASQTVRQVDAAAWEACPTCGDGSAVAELPDFATQSLTKVLSGEIPGAASVTVPPAGKDPKSRAGRTDSPGGSAADPAPELPSLDEPVTAPGTDGGGTKTETDLGKAIDGVVEDDLGIDGEPGIGPKPADGSTSSPSLTGTVVDGVTGILGGLLK